MPTRESLTEKVTTFGTSSRRTFLKWSAAAGASAGLISIASQTQPDLAPVAHAEGFPGADKTVWNACIINCGSRCPLRVQVKDGQVVRLLPDNTGDDGLLTRNIKACVRGRNMRERLYSPDRIKYPMKRKEGTKRGDGQWEQIGWDEAATIFATKLKEVYEKHGPEAILRMYGSGTWNSHINYEVMWRLLNCTGGQLNYYGNYSFSQLHTANKYHYGPYGETPSNSFEDSVTNGRMLVLWGNNPRETRMSGGGALFTSLAAARKAGLKVVVIDPMYSDSAALLADEWLAPRPGSDAALVAAIVHELLARDLHDQEFLNRYCVGFDEATMPEGVPANQSYRAYIEGKGPDGFEKTPEWASRITGLPAHRSATSPSNSAPRSRSTSPRAGACSARPTAKPPVAPSTPWPRSWARWASPVAAMADATATSGTNPSTCLGSPRRIPPPRRSPASAGWMPFNSVPR